MQKLGVVDSWVVYEGEVMKGKHGTRKNPICCVRKHTNMLKLLGNPNPNVKAYVYNGGSDKRYAYAIEGSYAQRMCKVLDETRRVVAEIKRKEALREHVSFGIEIFHLVVHPGFDPAFAMALVLLLDQM
ncbi:hypothetical protein L6164_028279 [Bauhinia variegata]|uniref:Uncharacterized protein n=1 Tax=Bauhinia variegata TaxID=167791 RepID=A0ACB9LWP2_BAUVA|nr:hypothetical protein L6164_028279 [Bauhinia variegata]